jgi:hypothetical protein
MIILSELEKEFLKRIVDLSERTHDMFLGNLLDKDLRNIDVYLERQRNIAEFRFDQQFFPADTDFIYKVREMSWTFMKLVKLLKYLEGKNYLYLYQESEPENTSRFGQLIKSNPYIAYQIYDPDIKKLLIDYAHRTIIVGQTVIDYVKNNYQTIEQIRHIENKQIAEQNLKVANDSIDKAEIGIIQSKKSVKTATGAIIVSIALGLISIWTSFYLSEKQSKNPITIEKTQFESLKHDIKLIDSTISNLKIVDTLKTEIVNEIEIKTAGNK